jgi:SHS2 domain-containing protein
MAEFMSDDHYEIVDHTADWAIRVTGANLAELLRHAAEGMSSLIAGELDALPLDESRTVELTSEDAEGLLVDWLSELAYWAEMEQMVFREFDMLEVTETHLKAVVQGGKAPVLHKHVKAVTYHNLAIVNKGETLETTIVFDV